MNRLMRTDYFISKLIEEIDKHQIFLVDKDKEINI